MLRPNEQTREINCDFFRVEDGKGSAADFVGPMAAAMANLKTQESRNFEIEGGYCRLYQWEQIDQGARGALLRLRTDGGARIGTMDSEDLRDIPLAPNEGLADYFCFCFFPDFNILVAHRNRDAGSCSRLNHYMKRHLKINDVKFVPVMNTEAHQRYQRMREFTLADIKIARPQNLQDIINRGRGLGGMLKAMNDAHANVLEMRVSVGRKRGHLSAEYIRHWIGELLGLPQEMIVSAEVHGNTDDEHGAVVDLIKDRIQQRVSISYTDNKPAIPDFFRAIETAYNDRQEELSRQFRK